MEGTNSIQLHRHYLIMTVYIAQITEDNKGWKLKYWILFYLG